MSTRKGLNAGRIWENVGKRNSNGNTVIFNVVSYNVLAQCLLETHSYLYTSSSPSSIDWTSRSARLYDEIVSLAPDIICFQEVQASHLTTFYAKFEKIGYSGIFKQRTGGQLHGCAIYFKASMFDLKDKINVELKQNLSLLNRDNIGLIVKLSHRNRPGSDFVIATSHFLYNPKRNDVRLAQMRLFLAEIDRVAYFKTESDSGYLPIILTGDFNSHPDSAVIELLDTGHVALSQYPCSSRVSSLDWQCIGITEKCQHLTVYLNRQEGKASNFSDLKIYNSEYSTSVPDSDKSEDDPRLISEQQIIELFKSGIISHRLNLASVYTKYKPDGSCEATTFQGYWVTTDYIYYSRCSALQVTDRLRLPTVVECAEGLGPMPNDLYGSDHFVLAAVFQYTPKEEAQ